MALGPGGVEGAAAGLASGVAQRFRAALGGAEEPPGAAEVEDLGVAAEDGGDDLGGAGQPAGVGGGDGLVAEVGDQRGADLFAESRVVDGDDDGGGVPAV